MHHNQQISMQQRRRQQAGQNPPYQNKAGLNHGSASSAHFQVGNPNPLATSQNFNRGNMIKKSAPAQQKYSDEEGFMRGARIAEKIQEYISHGGPGQTIPSGTQNSKLSSF
jgi:hypothetical protein